MAVIEITEQNFEQEVLKSDIPVLVDFWAVWCGPCRMQGPIVDELAEEVNSQDVSLLTGRLSNNTIVHFPGDASMIGKIMDVRLEACHGFYYVGKAVQV